MKLSNPLPQPLPKECEKAAKIFKSFVDNSNNGLDGVIPRGILEGAKGFAIFTIVKAGFLFSARAGSGIVIAKLDDGSWSAPSAIGTAGVGLGGQAGAEMTDFLVVLNSASAIRSFMAAGSLTLGGNMSLALGPLGRTGEASGSLNTKGNVAAMYSYSKTRGLFGGVSIEGSVIVERQDANSQAYNSTVSARQLLGGSVDPPPWAMPLIKTLDACTGMPGNNREWVSEDIPRTPGGTYAFGGLASPGSSIKSAPSFLRKKKKEEPPHFPPASWTEESKSESYFSSAAPQSHSRNITWDGGNYNNFTTKFESDFTPDKPKYDEETTTNPFKPASSRSSQQSFDKFSRPNNKSTLSSTPSHLRSMSSNYRSSSLLDDSPFDTEYDRQGSPASKSPPHQAIALGSSSAVPYLKTRDELTKPLLPHEGVARAIALFDYNAAEAGDLSFKKGEVITVTKKSNSSDDWWTGKIQGRQGIFPANFVEIA